MGHVITIAQQKGGSGKTTLAVNLAVEFSKRGQRVALLDTDPQGSLGRWFLARRDGVGVEGLEFSTASAWGVSYECEKLRKSNDLVIVDTPPKVDADLRPALREADLVLIPIASSALRCRSTGRAPMAQPPGSETMAWPSRASIGPSTRIEARILRTMS